MSARRRGAHYRPDTDPSTRRLRTARNRPGPLHTDRHHGARRQPPYPHPAVPDDLVLEQAAMFDETAVSTPNSCRAATGPASGGPGSGLDDVAAEGQPVDDRGAQPSSVLQVLLQTPSRMISRRTFVLVAGAGFEPATSGL
jgi:hypothetical protein